MWIDHRRQLTKGQMSDQTRRLLDIFNQERDRPRTKKQSWVHCGCRWIVKRTGNDCGFRKIDDKYKWTDKWLLKTFKMADLRNIAEWSLSEILLNWNKWRENCRQIKCQLRTGISFIPPVSPRALSLTASLRFIITRHCYAQPFLYVSHPLPNMAKRVARSPGAL